MSVTQLMENIRERSKTKLGKKLYNGDQTTMLRDVEAMLALHKKKKETLPYFKEKYGDDVGETYRNFLNTLFGLMTKDQQGINPMFETEGVKYSSNVFKSRRLDRINHTARLVGRPALPFGYDQVKVNLFPVGVPVEGGNLSSQFQPLTERAMQEAGVAFDDKDHTVEMLHITRKSSAKKISESGEILGTSFFTQDPEIAKRFGQRISGPKEIMSVKIDTGSLAATGGYFTQRTPKLVRGSDGVFRAVEASRP
jgi:hypothetical protein